MSDDWNKKRLEENDRYYFIQREKRDTYRDMCEKFAGLQVEGVLRNEEIYAKPGYFGKQEVVTTAIEPIKRVSRAGISQG